MQISVVVPLLNEQESLPELTAWIHRVLNAHQFSYEVILIDDGSRDGSWEMITELVQQNNTVKGIKFRRNYGKSAALSEGFRVAQGDVVITMDADLQDSPDEVPGLYRMVTVDGFDLVSGWKKKRHDPASKRWPSKLFNRVTGYMSGIAIHDFNCGLKAYKKEVVKNIEVYGEMHRYIPLLAKWAGFTRIGEKEVVHYPRKYGVTKFGWERFINGFLDLLSIIFVARFGKRPMHLFGTLGLISFFAGFLILLYLSIGKIFFDVTKMTERPIFYLGLVTMVIGVQLFLSGFLAELISRNAHDRNAYQVDKQLNF
ncbi:MAG: glycosyltransferase family 2 protein [Chitinophagales bacterium]|nr:glycosyltransferase family 2 protein [Chitinophagaceae bacterium]MBP9881820.1 glycosyltransferase family 2 protein [Chitinophagales bacterium]